jgi:RNA-binding protein
MAEIELTPKRRQELKGAAHRLDPVVLLGAGGLSEAVVKEIDRALTAHELIKVRVPGEDRAARDEIFRDVAERLGAARVQMIGKLLVLFRPNPEKAKEAAAGARSTKAPAPRPPRKPVGPSVRTKADKRDIRATAPRPAPRRDAKAIERGTTRRPTARRGAARSR